MPSSCRQVSDDVDRLATMQAAFLSHVDAAVDQLQRTECLDEEQRAEIHAILEALRHEGHSRVEAAREFDGEYHA